MWSTIWHTFFFDPVYNGLILFIDIVPGGDVGIAIILITILVKVILLPLSLKAARTQRLMRELDPKLKEIKEKFKDKREELAKATMEAYKNAGLNPFASILLMFIQIPIIIALYLAVYRGGGIPLPEINVALLFSFVPSPETVNMMFIGLIDMAGKSLPLALLAGGTQFIHSKMSIPKPEPRKDGAKPSMKEDFARSMQMQMRYVMPLIIFFVAYTISASIALYFTVSNFVAIAQEYVVKKHR
ncbi:YidC/Oxa1 family membrane protein insertase [Candidatus Pacebacteria bacterium]|nr:YidC/Oxa1 family membrane protein insertase [Candidatus Paceibacterota bacterium]